MSGDGGETYTVVAPVTRVGEGRDTYYFAAIGGEIADQIRKRLWPMIAAGSVAVTIDSEFALADAADAHRRMESSDHIGKIVLKAAA